MRGLLCQDSACCGLVRVARPARQGKVWHGSLSAGVDRRGKVRGRKTRRGKVRSGEAMRGNVGQGKAVRDKGWSSVARLGTLRSPVGFGMVRHGAARSGILRCAVALSGNGRQGGSVAWFGPKGRSGPASCGWVWCSSPRQGVASSGSARQGYSDGFRVEAVFFVFWAAFDSATLRSIAASDSCRFNARSTVDFTLAACISVSAFAVSI